MYRVWTWWTASFSITTYFANKNASDCNQDSRRWVVFDYRWNSPRYQLASWLFWSQRSLVPEKFGRQEIWSMINLVPAWKSNYTACLGRDQISLGPNFLGAKLFRHQISWGPKMSGAQMRLGTNSFIAWYLSTLCYLNKLIFHCFQSLQKAKGAGIIKTWVFFEGGPRSTGWCTR